MAEFSINATVENIYFSDNDTIGIAENGRILMVEFSINATVVNIYFLNHDAIIIVIEQNNVDFHLFHKVQYYQAIKKDV